MQPVFKEREPFSAMPDHLHPESEQQQTEAAAAPAPAPAPAESPADALADADWQAQVATLHAKNQELADQFLRAQADMQNTRRRAEEEVSKARKYALEGFAESL